MLINFCRKSLETAINCSTVSNDGYEVTNLISDSNKGFLAYSCIKPPIHIDFTFICDIQLSHILIWPSIGAQKSSGFEISIKSCKYASEDYKKVSTGFLNSSQRGLLFYRRDFSSSLEAPVDFLHRYIHISNGQIDRVKNLRLSIIKTENSVPAIGGIEVWGRVSQSCRRDVAEKIHSLWMKNVVGEMNVEMETGTIDLENVTKDCGDSPKEEFNVPESFLDPITWSIMNQPIVLPSGATIDQSTLEKHAKTEATWGRVLSDPFTGLPFNESRKPILASALKARIDKFLLENKHLPDIKNLPRSSGHKQIRMSLRNRSLDLTEISSPNILNPETAKRRSDKPLQNKCCETSVANSKVSTETRAHRLPVIPMCSKRILLKKKSVHLKKIVKSTIQTGINDTVNLLVSQEEIGDLGVKTALSNLQRFDVDKKTIEEPDCLKDCKCETRIFYQLPCRHIICRDTLTSIKNLQCAICDTRYNSGDPVRIHRHS